MSRLIKTTYGALLDSGKTPSGLTYELRPDTVETGLKVAEAKDDKPWRQKAMQVLAVTESVGGVNVRSNGGVDFIAGLPDVDVAFLAMAWTSDVNGREMKLASSVPCPHCNSPFNSIDLGGLVVMVRDEPVTGPDAIINIDIPDDVRLGLPPSLKDGQLKLKDVTWRDSRIRIPASCAGDTLVIDQYRVMSALLVSHDGQPPRAVLTAESLKFRMRVIQFLIQEADKVLPNFTHELQIKCAVCGGEIDIPFDRAGT